MVPLSIFGWHTKSLRIFTVDNSTPRYRNKFRATSSRESIGDRSLSVYERRGEARDRKRKTLMRKRCLIAG